MSFRENQYRKQFAKWGVVKQLRGIKNSRRPRRSCISAPSDEKHDEAKASGAAESEGCSPIFSWRMKLDGPWSGMEYCTTQERNRIVLIVAGGEPDSQLRRQQLPPTVGIASSPRSSTFSGWASFRDTHTQAPDPYQGTKENPKSSSYAVNPQTDYEHRDHRQHQSLPSNKTLSSYGSETPSEPGLQSKDEESLECGSIDLGGISVSRSGGTGLSRQGMLGHI